MRDIKVNSMTFSVYEAGKIRNLNNITSVEEFNNYIEKRKRTGEVPYGIQVGVKIKLNDKRRRKTITD